MGKENQKYNGAIWKIVVLALAVAAGYGALRYRVVTVEAKADNALVKADSNENSIIQIKRDLKYILKGQDEQKEMLKEIQKELKNEK